jgi:hypothetical protein
VVIAEGGSAWPGENLGRQVPLGHEPLLEGGDVDGPRLHALAQRLRGGQAGNGAQILHICLHPDGCQRIVGGRNCLAGHDDRFQPARDHRPVGHLDLEIGRDQSHADPR